MSFTEKNIYELLPAYYRAKDAEQGRPLQALINIIAERAVALENNIEQLYDNWFIETCEDWVIPYIADLLGVQNFTPIKGSSAVSQRGFVANTLAYRRRKGIAPVLEQLANDISGWNAHVAEFFQLLATTQYMNHIRLDHPATADLRLMNKLDLLGSSFDTIAHAADVRHVSNGRGKYNIPNIGLFIWRIQSYKVMMADARMLPCLASPPSTNSFYFTFNPLGYDTQLFNNPNTETAIIHISEEINLPVLLRSRALYDELDARRRAIVDGVTFTPVFFGDAPVFQIYANENTLPVPPQEILICDLEKCCIPPKSISYQSANTGLKQSMPISVAVDPVKGRFVFTDPSITKARVNYSYGFSADVGSGSYDRQDAIPENFRFSNHSPKDIWQVGVSKTIKSIGSEKIYTTIAQAVNDWNNGTQRLGIISIMDSKTYDNEVLNIQMGKNRQLLIISADWPAIPDENIAGVSLRIPGILSANRLQPLIAGNISIDPALSPSDFETQQGGQITLNGLLISGKIKITEGNLQSLNISNCSLVPASNGVDAGFDTTNVRSNQWLKINIQKSICGPVNLNNTEFELLSIDDSIIGNGSDYALLSMNAALQLNRTTVFGKVISKTISADNCIFNDLIKIERKQTGCIRFSFVPFVDPNTLPETPRRFRCQPELEINTQVAIAKKDGASPAELSKIRKQIFQSVVPAFVSTNYGHYAYAQLSTNCPSQISAGADDGAEMGAFHLLMQPQRKANLLTALDEYLRVGLESGLFYVT
ncbi:hypothetical protein EFY79_00645 [Hanamia caeni]|uniref:Uncharacterized protein n=1 Tax=Hanamia caeni TaxID=2294116 RepID=A0A3M9NQ97_9BACT|nr:hypothetical protein [Hanamia caeni]RNI39844.1 hypothetical protein EFY79_00645 [Hanamia caeni]